MLTIFTIVVCVVSYLLNITAFLTYFSYVLAFAILKAFLSKKLKDVFNIRKAEAIYTEVGLMNTLDSFISLLFITLYYVFREYEHFGIEYMLPVLLCYILIYRFLFWNVGYKVKQLFRKSHQQTEYYKRSVWRVFCVNTEILLFEVSRRQQEIFKIICEVGRALMKGIFARA